VSANPERLYHFTCDLGHAKIGRYNCVLMPQPGSWPVIWFTSEAVPDFEATGLGRLTLKCDRTEFRYVVTGLSTCRPWLGSPERLAETPQFLRALEEFSVPEQWWISAEPVQAEWDRSWERAA